MDSHPIHVHGHHFEVAGTDAGPVPSTARFREVTTDVPVGATRDIEFVADNPGDWPFHCHKSHHTMNAMSHDLPNMIGVDPHASDAKIRQVLPGCYQPQTTTGRPPSSLPCTNETHAGQPRQPSRGVAATSRGQKTWRTTWAVPDSATDAKAATGSRRDEGGTELGLGDIDLAACETFGAG